MGAMELYKKSTFGEKNLNPGPGPTERFFLIYLKKITVCFSKRQFTRKLRVTNNHKLEFYIFEEFTYIKI